MGDERRLKNRETLIGRVAIVSFIIACVVAIGWIATIVLYQPSNEKIVANAADCFPRSNNAIDAVYTWVDPNDRRWREMKEHWHARTFGNGVKETASHWPATTGASTPPKHTEMFWSMVTLAAYAPWLRHVYVVTQRPQCPSWIKWNDRRAAGDGIDRVGSFRGLSVRLVHHDRILPVDCLPVFNSCAIESGIHRCSGLANQFIYCNDDFYLAAPLPPAALFDSHSRPYLRCTPTLHRTTVKLLGDNLGRSFNSGWDNVARLGLPTDNLPWHHITPMSVEVMTAASRDPLLKRAWRRTERARFRGTGEIPPIGASLMWAYVHGEVHVASPKYSGVIRSTLVPVMDSAFAVDALLRAVPHEPHKRPHMLCVNDVSTSDANNAFERAIFPWMEQYWPLHDMPHRPAPVRSLARSIDHGLFLVDSVAQVVAWAHDVLRHAPVRSWTVAVVSHNPSRVPGLNDRLASEYALSWYRQFDSRDVTLLYDVPASAVRLHYDRSSVVCTSDTKHCRRVRDMCRQLSTTTTTPGAARRRQRIFVTLGRATSHTLSAGESAIRSQMLSLWTASLSMFGVESIHRRRIKRMRTEARNQRMWSYENSERRRK